jgi:hypothetical protein
LYEVGRKLDQNQKPEGASLLHKKTKRPDEIAAEAALLPLFRYQISINR